MKRIYLNVAIGSIIVAAAILRLLNVTGPDMITDDALYAFRAVGYFDYIGSLDTQTTPVVWFSETQWWQKLSFHDAPPFVFVIEHIFFALLGDSIFAARLPVVLFGLLSIFGIFLLGKLIGGEFLGLAAASIMSVLNYHVWISRIGFLDGFLLPSIIFAVYFFIKAKDKPINYLWWLTAMAFGFLTKYTFVFLIPCFGLTALIFRRSMFRKRWFYLGLAVFFLLLSPVIIYNFMVWKTRGHFDAALSTMVGLEPEDFKILTRHIRTEVGGILGVIKTVALRMSLPMRSWFLISFLILIYRSFKNKKDDLFFLLTTGTIFGIITLFMVGGDQRFNVILIPFITLFMAISAKLAYEKLTNYRHLLVFVGIIIFLWELLFSIQSQIIPQPIIAGGLFYDAQKPGWFGYNELDKYVENFYRENPNPNYILFSITPQLKEYKTKIIKSFYEHGQLPQQEHLLAFDDRLEWFATAWIVERRRLYEARAIPTLTNIIEALDENYIDKFLEFGFEDVTLITLADKKAGETVLNTERIEKFMKTLEENYQPTEEIKNARGEAAFLVYHLTLNKDLEIFKN